MKFRIWSIEHGAWWAYACRGYTRDIDKAGRYDQAEAFEIVASANQFLNSNNPPHEALVPVVDERTKRS